MLRLGVKIEYEGRNYDILELPPEAFIQLIPGVTSEQYRQIDEYFMDFWPEPTRRRHYILAFAAQQIGSSIDFLLLNRRPVQFDESDLQRYVELHTKQGHRPS